MERPASDDDPRQMDLFDELQGRVVCGDGAMGTMLIDGGVPLEHCLEELSLTVPERIGTIHRQYIAAGARLIKTNTFGANAVRLTRFGLEERVSEINHAAARIAIEAARGKDVYIAGSVGPLGMNGEEAKASGINPRQCFREQVGALLDADIRIIFFETFTNLPEMETAFQGGKEAGEALAICSFATGEDGGLTCGTPLIEAWGQLRELGATILGVNCTSVSEITALLRRGQVSDPIVVSYPNAGRPSYSAGHYSYPMTPEHLAESAGEWVANGARLIGGCCGTTPRHISALSRVLEGLPLRQAEAGEFARGV